MFCAKRRPIMDTFTLTLAAALFVLCASPLMAQETQPPPGEAGAKDALNSSPRHGEWVDIAVPGRATPVRSYVVYPERPDKAPVIVVIHEIFGLSDWVRSVTDRLAADGFLAIAPDLLSGAGPDGGGTDSFKDRDEVTKSVRGLEPGAVDAMLTAVMGYGLGLPAASDKAGIVGFCWGGSQSFRAATVHPDLDAAVVYYGTSPDLAALDKIHAPVLGLYGSDDARVNATVPPAQEKMKQLGKLYEVHTFEGAGHGFLRGQDGRAGANRRAAEQAWPATVRFLAEHTKAGG
jgi:carboxymethylenebutenolidase